MAPRKTAILSVYNKQGLLDLAKGMIKHDIRLLASGGTAKLIREAGFDVQWASIPSEHNVFLNMLSHYWIGTFLPSRTHRKY